MIEGKLVERVERKEWAPTGERILITGFSGLVGFGIVEAALAKDRLIGLARGETENIFKEDARLETVTVELLDKEKLSALVKEKNPSIIIHLAGASDVDKCQKEPDWARTLNVEGTRNIVEVAKVLDKPLIYFSTDYVFPRLGGPFSESDRPEPLTDVTGAVINVYGQTKREGELVVEELPEEQRIIVRIASPYNYRYEKKPGAPPFLLKLLKEGKPLKVVYDAKTTYTFGPDIALALNRLILEKIWQKKNVAHIAGPEQLSALDIVTIAAEYFPASKIESVTLDNYFSGRAPRPLQGGLKTETLNELGVKMRSWKEVLESAMARLPV